MVRVAQRGAIGVVARCVSVLGVIGGAVDGGIGHDERGDAEQENDLTEHDVDREFFWWDSTVGVFLNL